ncbi:MAG: restriction endonuclease subunit S [bacterium]
MNNLQRVRLEDITINWDKKRIPLSSAERANLEKKYRYYGAQGVIDYVDNFLFDGEYVLVAEDGENLRSQRNNICNYVTGKFWVNNHAHIIQAKANNNLKYIYYRLNLVDFSPYITGSAQPKLTQDNMNSIELTVHDYISQQKIAAVLSALDAKIELNQRINAELEAMAKTLYEYWFVQNSTLKKWEKRILGEFVKINERSITKEYKHNDIKYIDIASVSVGRLEGTSTHALKNAPSRARRLVNHGDTIWSTVRPNRKSYLFICNPSNNLVVSTGFAVITPKKIPASFLYFLTTSEEFVHYLVSNAEGSAYPAVSADRFAEFVFLLPPKEQLEKFEDIVSPMLAKISQNELESQTLTELRDWLLPMLMNGEVTV